MKLPIFSIVFNNFSRCFTILFQSMKHFWFLVIPVMITAHLVWNEIIYFCLGYQNATGWSYGYMFHHSPGQGYNNMPDSIFHHTGHYMFPGHMMLTFLLMIMMTFLLMWVAVVWMNKTISHSEPDMRFDSRFVLAMLLKLVLGFIIIVPVAMMFWVGGSLDTGGALGGIVNILTVIAIIAWVMFCYRFIVIFPAIAMGNNIFRFKAALALTKGNTVQIFAGLLFTVCIFTLMAIGLGYIIQQLPINFGTYVLSLFLVSVFLIYYTVHISEFISLIYMWLINMEIA